jgi:hypothetical protein
MNQGARGIVRAKALSALAVEKLAQSAFVGAAPGLELWVTTHGIRGWRLFYRLPGDRRRRAIKLGPDPTLSLAEARKRAHKALARVSEGINPRLQLQVEARRAGVTVFEAFTDYPRFCANENTPAPSWANGGCFIAMRSAPMAGCNLRRSVVANSWRRLTRSRASKRRGGCFTRHCATSWVGRPTVT